MTDRGVVRTWSEDEGWGVIDAPATPGGCWAHFSALAADAFWEPQAGDRVDLTWEVADQDGLRFRATRVWPAGTEPVDDESEAPGSAHGSDLTIEFD
jgi:CspA family cold shock protein